MEHQMTLLQGEYKHSWKTRDYGLISFPAVRMLTCIPAESLRRHTIMILWKLAAPDPGTKPMYIHIRTTISVSSRQSEDARVSISCLITSHSTGEKGILITVRLTTSLSFESVGSLANRSHTRASMCLIRAMHTFPQPSTCHQRAPPTRGGIPGRSDGEQREMRSEKIASSVALIQTTLEDDKRIQSHAFSFSSNRYLPLSFLWLSSK